jgi:hypothetical protein
MRGARGAENVHTRLVKFTNRTCTCLRPQNCGVFCYHMGAAAVAAGWSVQRALQVLDPAFKIARLQRTYAVVPVAPGPTELPRLRPVDVLPYPLKKNVTVGRGPGPAQNRMAGFAERLRRQGVLSNKRRTGAQAGGASKRTKN